MLIPCTILYLSVWEGAQDGDQVPFKLVRPMGRENALGNVEPAMTASSSRSFFRGLLAKSVLF